LTYVNASAALSARSGACDALPLYFPVTDQWRVALAGAIAPSRIHVLALTLVGAW
jgi:hypothetical protein